ncbi:nucleotidyltransferase domain-containing protein [Myroides sp. DF42-4-2]|uniref:nucleotidyltransferase domain-containing protein n=1 Tax=unclassified Myroides TaxID=2642485 RepID=UPI00257890BB|nr:nucleotidyltransferase domain-containing protein [Myroides sp. DF42-4-2]MDM1406548.1 nucleotidyltransferase domain-containing protein [Myroides sp. DF42-4-2]
MENKHKQALKQAQEWISQNFNPKAILVGGSIVRNQHNTNSDLDIHVIHDASFRQRHFKYFNQIACDIFINNPEHIKNYFIEEHKKNRPSTAHLLTTSIVLFGQEYLKDLLKLAHYYLQTPRKYSTEELQQQRYYITTLLEDATDILQTDTNCCTYILNTVISEVITYYYNIHQHYLPRIKNRIQDIQVPDLQRIFTDFYRAKNNEERIQALHALFYQLDIPIQPQEWHTEPST